MIFYITGNDTGVGKTVLTATWTRYLRDRGHRVVALKPLASGGRTDPRLLWESAGRIIPLDEVNPWWFRAPIAPAAAARRIGLRIELPRVVQHVQRLAQQFEIVLVEGAGGLLSPLGTNFDNRDLMQALQARPIVVVPNRLGAVNQTRLVCEALAGTQLPRPHCVLVNQPHHHPAIRTHAELLASYLPQNALHFFPWLRTFPDSLRRAIPPAIRNALTGLTTAVLKDTGDPRTHEG
ncbi:dethiobiotin synthase [Limisphaera ngatamarikiensis]|uniref:ATP-dependent dethiobiotin synthetase BioD n=1 Tax=Limisphaera ngatamarikiensis TaxID=1324935 RepID=A0A6M1RUN7_9BACT|nr:dethiobiotin synthase [Limisphaera ngatamarikiensis]NGO40345.1 dethiobiotin synthase [Limisphaera ngatamarikiensis]